MLISGVTSVPFIFYKANYSPAKLTAPAPETSAVPRL